jgi:hypothetical protein
MPCFYTALVHLLVIQAIGYVYTQIFVLTAIVCVLHAKASYLSSLSEENTMLYFIYNVIFNYKTVMILKIRCVWRKYLLVCVTACRTKEPKQVFFAIFFLIVSFSARNYSNSICIPKLDYNSVHIVKLDRKIPWPNA